MMSFLVHTLSAKSITDPADRLTARDMTVELHGEILSIQRILEGMRSAMSDDTVEQYKVVEKETEKLRCLIWDRIRDLMI